jgi:hypothetical protein
VHKGLREVYGEPYREGDVIGCLLHLPPGGRVFLPNRNVCALCCQACIGDFGFKSCAAHRCAPSIARMQPEANA